MQICEWVTGFLRKILPLSSGYMLLVDTTAGYCENRKKGRNISQMAIVKRRNM